MTAPAAATTAGDGKRVYVVDGRPMPSANTVLGVLNKEGLNIWKLKKVARAIALDPQLQRIAADGSEYMAAKRALDDGPNPEADLGTAVHAAIEWWFTRRESAWQVWHEYEDLANVQAHLDRFVEMAHLLGIRPVWIEQSVCHVHLDYAGTTDGFVHLDPGADPSHICDMDHVYDAKSGKTVYPDVALQLAAYAHATHRVRYDEELGANVIDGPLENVCPSVGYVASVHADRAELIPMSLRDAWPAFVAARDVQRWEEMKKGAMAPPLKVNLDPW